MTQTKTRRPRRTYTDEFKTQLVQLYLMGNVNVILFANTIFHPLYSTNGLNNRLLPVLLKRKTTVQRKKMN